MIDSDCASDFTCAPNPVSAGVADSDGDGLADPYDNCPSDGNIDQADADLDEIGDACDLMTCGNGVAEFSEECDDGDQTDGDGCSTTCETEESLSLFGIAEGGSVSVTVEGVVIAVGTTSGQSADVVVGALANAINADPTLNGLGVTATASGNVLWTTGHVTATSIDDAGLAGIPVPVGFLLPVALAVALAAVARRELAGRRARS